jgi:hypothetical protein
VNEWGARLDRSEAVLKVHNMKRSVTVKIDTDLLREARILAAEQGSSICALVAAQLEKAVRERTGTRRHGARP